MTLYSSLKTQADNSTAWIVLNGATLIALIATVAGINGTITTIQAQLATINTTLGDHDARISTVTTRTTNISYSQTTTSTTIGGAKLNVTNEINATTLKTSGNIETTGGSITAFGDISSSGIVKGGTVNTNNINCFTGSSMNIGNSATTINMGSSTLGNTINVGNLLSTINLNGDVRFTSNNPFSMPGGNFYQF